MRYTPNGVTYDWSKPKGNKVKKTKKKTKKKIAKKRHIKDYYGKLPDALVLDVMHKIYKSFWDLKWRQTTDLSTKKAVHDKVGGSSTAFQLAFNILIKSKIIQKRSGQYHVIT